MTDTTTIAEAERFLDVDLPPNARNVRVSSERGVDTLVLLRFDAPASQVDAFAARLLPGGLTPGKDPELGHLGGDLDWWVRTLPAGSAGGEATDARRNRTYRLVSAPAGEGVTTLWLAAFNQ